MGNYLSRIISYEYKLLYIYNFEYILTASAAEHEKKSVIFHGSGQFRK